MDNLEKLAMPLVEHLKKNHNPHCSIVVTESHVKVLTVQQSIPINQSGGIYDACQDETTLSQGTAS